MLLLGSLLKSFLVLERLFLFDNAPIQRRELGWIHPTETADVVVQFATKMKRLLAVCVEFFQFNPALVEEIRSRIVEEVVPARSNLWFHVDRKRPYVADVPPIHYFGLIEPNYSVSGVLGRISLGRSILGWEVWARGNLGWMHLGPCHLTRLTGYLKVRGGLFSMKKYQNGTELPKKDLHAPNKVPDLHCVLSISIFQ